MSALNESIRIATIAAKAADEKNADDIAVIDVSDMIAITDCFVLASVDNERQVAAIVEEIETEMTAAGFEPKRREGNRENRWVLLDYGIIVIHIQRQAERDFYGLDRLYRDCPLIEVEGIETMKREASWADEADVRNIATIDELPPLPAEYEPGYEED
ncbi:ribosome silencing factor [Corynebacterium callunae]|uniref:Ribosomal silencing factor RsfS n=1 Tax=Corynebacterium callunae DSM 20147 TaxID=1121353 RepID=M1TT85_9CORY|nr:ribosome silencing factor [Corynebacterium callunae]AGG67416.1 hypothetical protein H924_09890 [Corynebacterium callunae DSM 20147]